jgi:hypothetical protein
MRYLAGVAADDLDGIFAGSVTMPMLTTDRDLSDIGEALVDRYQGGFHRCTVAPPCTPGEGLLERLVTESPLRRPQRVPR